MEGLTNLKRKPKKIEEMTKEQIKQAILRKRECNAKAQAIVESLIETSASEVYFLECLKNINQNHFEDIIEERSITDLCGYPICPKSLSKNDIPKQKYRISVKTNKVYDITKRKNFCSNTCYKAAMYIKNQMLTSPLWFREYEEIPKFNLLPLDSVGSLGQEIDLSLTEKLDIKSDKQLFTTVNDFARMHVQKLHQNERNQNENNANNNTSINQKITSDKELISEKTASLKTSENSINTNEIEDDCLNTNIDITQQLNREKSETTEDSDKVVKTTKVPKNMEETNLIPSTRSFKPDLPKPLLQKVDLCNIVGEIVEKPEKKIDSIPTSIPDQSNKFVSKVSPTNNKDVACVNNKKRTKKEYPISVITTQVEMSLAEWFSLDTVFFLLGEERVRELVIDKTDIVKDYINNYVNSISYNSNTYDQYQQLCRRLNLLELEDKKNDFDTLLQKITKPLPDYSVLKEESKKIKLKVKAFLAGETEIPVDESPEIHKRHKNEDSNFTQLPLVDKNAQNALRRRIVHQHLNKVLPSLMSSLGLLTLNISSDVRLLVSTFKLKANNIIFKPIQWTLVAIVIIKLLSMRNPQLEFLLNQQLAYQHLQLLLLSYKQDGGYLDRLVMWLTDINRILDMRDSEHKHKERSIKE